MTKYVRAYHFVGATLRDGSSIPPDGEWLVHDGDIRICKSGYHASIQPFDALQYAPNSTLCLVECDDVVAQQSDKLVCRRRRIVARFDATDFLWEAARAWALEVVHLWNAPTVVIEYLQTGDESKRAAAWDAARAAAWAAAWDAARAAAGAAAWAAAWAATRDAAGAAARDAAGAAAWAAARDAAGAAAWAAARDAAKDAAGAAAWAAARDAARDAQRQHFNDAVADEFIRMGAAP